MSYLVAAAFRDLMLQSADVQTLVAKRIYANRAPQWPAAGEPTNYVVYFRVDSIVERDLSRPSALRRTRFQVDVYARSYGDAQDIATAIREACDGFRGTVTGAAGSLVLHGVTLEDERDQYEADESSETGWHRVSLDFQVWHEVSVPVRV